MIDRLLHSPEGVRDIYNSECRRKLGLEGILSEVLHRYGYKDIQTPTFEYFDVFSDERGTVASKDIYKFFDREGNTLVLRPDITPAIARCVAKYYKEVELPIRLCYCGNIFINKSEYQGKLKENTQCGAELVNDASVQADAEMLALTIECLKEAGLNEFQVEVGEVNFFKGLMEESKLDADEIEQLKTLIENKNSFGIEAFIADTEIPEDDKRLLMSFPELFGSIDKLSAIKSKTVNKRAAKAIQRLEELFNLIKSYGYEQYISFDLGMLSKYEYYTGVIFNGYTYGSGEAVVSGGRYDTLVRQFGKDAPAIGVGINVDQLILALDRQKLDISDTVSDVLVIYDTDRTHEAIKKTKELRHQGDNCEMLIFNIERQAELESYIVKHEIKTIYALLNTNSEFLTYTAKSKEINDRRLGSGVKICVI